MNDDDVKGYFKQQDYGMRIYDPRVGRFLSVDPLTKYFPWYTPYQFAGNKPIWAVDLDGLEEAKVTDFSSLLNYVGEQWKDYWSDVTPESTVKSFNRTWNPVGIAWYNGYQILTAKDFDTKQPASRVDAVGNIIITVIYHQAGTKLAAPSATVKMEQQMTRNTVTTEAATNKQATAANNGNTNAAASNAANKKAQQLVINNQNSISSEEIVFNRLQNQLGAEEAILRKPRIYIGNGSSGKYAVPDFAVYNTKTGQIARIVEAKDGAALPTRAQEQLNKYGGIFKGSSRAKDAKPQSVKRGMLEVEKTNVGTTNQ